MNVKIINHTPNPEKTIAIAGKLCYSPSNIGELEKKLTNESIKKFVNMIMSLGHGSVLEHVSFTFAVEGVSRSLTHQLVRHRIASYSQQSQRYVKLNQFQYIIPPEVDKDEETRNVFIETMENSQKSYDKISHTLQKKYISVGMKRKDAEKKAIENARAVLPNACETKIIFTMNLRTLLEFFNKRLCSRSQDEIRKMANLMLQECKKVSPLLFKNTGAKCKLLNYCPEDKMSCGLYPVKEILIGKEM